MQIIENSKVKEKLYIEKLKNGLTVMIIPKKGIQKKYIIWGTNYGSNDNRFIVPGENEITEVPKGVAHFLEHKMFEQENGRNSLDVLTDIGVSANAYTTNDHTAYLYEATDNFYEALDEFMDYVQHPYFTDENVEKEKGIIGQEIMMYDDYPQWKVYLNALECMYYNNPVKLDITGTIETISHIDKDILYKCYKTFYNPSNMAMVVAGDFEPEKLLEEIKKRLVNNKSNGEIKRIFDEEPQEIVKSYVEQNMEVSMPLFTIGIKDTPAEEKERVRKNIAIEILLNMIIGASSDLFKELYNKGNCYWSPSIEYDFNKNYAHILLTGQSNNPQELFEMFKQQVKYSIENGLNEEDVERTKKMIYGEYIKEYDDVVDISRMFLSDYFKGINSFDYLENVEIVNLEYLNQILKDVFQERKMILSVVKN
ncbi:peptidase M16 domain protein [Clostridium sp. CAG:575]|nr:peptidase M16 domain protein [Clostridium sp. CAG:575]